MPLFVKTAKDIKQGMDEEKRKDFVMLRTTGLMGTVGDFFSSLTDIW